MYAHAWELHFVIGTSVKVVLRADIANSVLFCERVLRRVSDYLGPLSSPMCEKPRLLLRTA